MSAFEAHTNLAETESSKRHERVLLAAVIVLYLAIACWNLNIQLISNPDEPRYAAAAREMLRSGDWLVPRFNGEPRVIKPLFFYWLIAAVGTAGEWCGLALSTALRLGPVLMGLLAVLAAFVLGRRMLGLRGGFLAAMLLLTTAFFHDVSRKLVIDMTLTAFVAWSWVFTHSALRRLARGGPAGGALPGMYACMGLTCMVKGPAPVAAFVVFPLLAYLVWSKRLPDLKRAGLWWGAPLALGIGVSWSVLLALRGQEVWKFYTTENFDRVAGAKDHIVMTPFVFYFETLAGDFLPWVPVLLIGAGLLWLKARGPKDSANGNADWRTRLTAGASEDAKLLASVLTVAFVCVGVAFSKRPFYILPLFPFLALWAAWIWEKNFLKNEGLPVAGVLSKAICGLLLLVAGGCLAVVLCAAKLKLLPNEQMVVGALGLAFVAALGWIRHYAAAGRRVELTLVLLAAAVSGHLAYEAVFRPVRERFLNRTEFYAQVRQLREGRPLRFVGLSSNEAVWHLYDPSRPDERFDDIRRTELKTQFFDLDNALLLVSETELTDDLRAALRLRPEKLVRGGEVFRLGEADPEHPPAPSVFEQRRVRNKKTRRDAYCGEE